MTAATEPARRPLHAAARAASWLYLLTVVWLVVWVVLARLLLGWTPVIITGESMAPRIQAGDIVLIDRRPRADQLGPGTVVTVDDPVEPGDLLTHRIVRRSPDGYQLRGDANAQPDSTLVPPAGVRGVGRLLVPALGLPVAWAHEGDIAASAACLLVSLAACGVALGRARRP